VFFSHIHDQKGHLFLLAIQVIYACFFIIYESIFIFLIFTSGSYELEEDLVKKKMKNYRKANTESRIAIKKVAIQSSDESIQLYEDERKSL